jgi:hypothetical protein
MQSDTTFQPNAPVGGSSSDSETGFSASSSLIDKVTPPWLAQHGSLSLDLICLSVAMLVTVFWMPIAAHPHALADVLAMRVSITNLLLAGACLGLWSVVLGQRIRKPATSPRVALTLLVQALTCTLPVAVLLEIRHHNMVNATTLVVFFALSFFLFLCGRLFAGLYRALIQPAIRQSRTILIVGSGPRGQALKQQLLAHSRWNYSFFGFVDPHPKDSSEPVLGDIDELETILMSNAIDEVVIALPVKSMYDQVSVLDRPFCDQDHEAALGRSKRPVTYSFAHDSQRDRDGLKAPDRHYLCGHESYPALAPDASSCSLRPHEQ